jgi:hypothetical protein
VQALDVISSGRGVRLGIVVEGEGRGPGTCVCDDLSTTTHPLQHRSFKLDRQETSATEVCESTFSFFLREKECAYDLLKEKNGRLGLVLVMICLRLVHIPFSTGVKSR